MYKVYVKVDSREDDSDTWEEGRWRAFVPLMSGGPNLWANVAEATLALLLWKKTRLVEAAYVRYSWEVREAEDIPIGTGFYPPFDPYGRTHPAPDRIATIFPSLVMETQPDYWGEPL